MKTLSEKIAVMQAFERGEPVGCRPLVASCPYYPCPHPEWAWNACDYEVLPREWWLSIHPDDPRNVFVFPTREDATRWDKNLPGFRRVVRVVEAYTDPDLQSLEL